MKILVLTLDREVAGHVAVAIRRHREALADRGRPRPEGLLDLEQTALAVFRGHDGTDEGAALELAAAGAYGGRDGQLLTQREFAAALGRDPRTIRRWLDRGELDAVTVSGCRRIPRAELGRFTTRGAA